MPPARTRLKIAAAAAAWLLVPWPVRGGFGLPVNVSRTSGSSFVPTLVVDRVGPSAGTARVFWHDFTSSPNLLWCAENTGAGWEPAAVCPPNVSASWTPRAVADSRGSTHLVWRDQTGGQDDIHYALWDGASWSTPVNISSTAGRSRNPTLAVDPLDNPHVLWEEDTSGLWSFFEAHYDGTSWSVAADTGFAFLQGAFLDTIRIVCDSTGTLHAAWQDGADFRTEIWHAERPAGGPWGAPELVSLSVDEISAEPALAVGPDDTLHCAWVEQDSGTGMTYEIWYATKPPRGVWSAPLDVSRQAGNTFRPTIAVDPADGLARIAWRLDVAGAGEIHFVAFPGDTPQNVSRSPGPSQRPSLVLDAFGEAYLAWHEQVGASWDIFVATTGPSIVLRAVKDPGVGDVMLGWLGGAPPYAVGRSSLPDVLNDWTDLTPPAGTPGPGWVDAGVVGDGATYYYRVEERR